MLFDIYSVLVRRFPDGCLYLFGSAVEEYSAVWLSVNAEAHPYVLFETTGNDVEADLKLKYVEVQFACTCDITLEDGTTKSGTYTVVTLKEANPDIVRVFLRLLEEALFSGGVQHDAGTIRRQILVLAELFSSLETNTADVIGLWGELHLLKTAFDVNRAVRAWCLAKTARFDFVTDAYVFEVKTTLKARREHRFSLEQLCPDSGVTAYIVSILLTELPSGKTVGELMDEVYSSILDAEDRKRFFRQCLKKGGKDIYSSGLRLGVYPGGKSVAVYLAGHLPTPQVEDGVPIRNVRFDLDVTDVAALPDTAAASLLAFSDPESKAEVVASS